MDRLERTKEVRVFTPIDEAPFRLIQNLQYISYPPAGSTTKPASAGLASQIVTGVERFELLALLEVMRVHRLQSRPYFASP